jgi:hypothetical protein
LIIKNEVAALAQQRDQYGTQQHASSLAAPGRTRLVQPLKNKLFSNNVKRLAHPPIFAPRGIVDTAWAPVAAFAGLAPVNRGAPLGPGWRNLKRK